MSYYQIIGFAQGNERQVRFLARRANAGLKHKAKFIVVKDKEGMFWYAEKQ